MARTIPIIQLNQNLLVSIQIELHDAVVLELKENLAEEILRKQVSGLIIELSGMDSFDSYIACAIRDIAHMGRLMGVRTVVAGFDAAIATTLVEMGIRMDGVDTAVSLEAALDLLKDDWDRCVQLREMALREINMLDCGDAAEEFTSPSNGLPPAGCFENSRSQAHETLGWFDALQESESSQTEFELVIAAGG